MSEIRSGIEIGRAIGDMSGELNRAYEHVNAFQEWLEGEIDKGNKWLEENSKPKADVSNWLMEKWIVQKARVNTLEEVYQALKDLR